MNDIVFFSSQFYIDTPVIQGDIYFIETSIEYYIIKIKLPERIYIG